METTKTSSTAPAVILTAEQAAVWQRYAENMEAEKSCLYEAMGQLLTDISCGSREECSTIPLAAALTSLQDLLKMIEG